jgi:hypothetical protein
VNLKTRRQRLAERARALGLVMSAHDEHAVTLAERGRNLPNPPDLADEPGEADRVARELVQATASEAARREGTIA